MQGQQLLEIIIFFLLKTHSQVWDQWKPFKNDEECFLFHLKSYLNEFWLYWTSISTKIHPMEEALMLLQFLCQTYQLHCPSSVYWLMSVSQKSDETFRFDIAYRKTFLYHRLAHELAYTCNTDDRFVDPHCSMFLQGSLTFSIHHLSNLMHHSQVCHCFKSNIFRRFDSQFFNFIHKYLVVDLNE